MPWGVGSAMGDALLDVMRNAMGDPMWGACSSAGCRKAGKPRDTSLPKLG